MEFEYPVTWQSRFVVGALQADEDNSEFGGFSGSIAFEIPNLTGRGGVIEVDSVRLCSLVEALSAWFEAQAIADVDGDGYSGPFTVTVNHYPFNPMEHQTFEGCES